MKALILAMLLALPTFLSASPKAHKVRLIFNVVDDNGGIAVMQDGPIGSFMFSQFVEGDPNLQYILDIGFKHIRSIMVDMSNDTQKKNQMVVVRTMDDRIIVKEIPFFTYSDPQPNRYVLVPSRFVAKKASRDVYYLASFSF